MSMKVLGTAETDIKKGDYVYINEDNGLLCDGVITFLTCKDKQSVNISEIESFEKGKQYAYYEVLIGNKNPRYYGYIEFTLKSGNKVRWCFTTDVDTEREYERIMKEIR